MLNCIQIMILFSVLIVIHSLRVMEKGGSHRSNIQTKWNLLWVELCPLKKIHLSPTPGTCECGLI